MKENLDKSKCAERKKGYQTAGATALTAFAASLSHTVVKGDTMWKLAVRYQVGTSEIIIKCAFPQLGQNLRKSS